MKKYKFKYIYDKFNRLIEYHASNGVIYKYTYDKYQTLNIPHET